MLPSLLCACSLFKYIILQYLYFTRLFIFSLFTTIQRVILFIIYIFLCFVACDHLKVYGWRPLSFPFNHESTKISVYVIISCLDCCILQSFCTFLLQPVVIFNPFCISYGHCASLWSFTFISHYSWTFLAAVLVSLEYIIEHRTLWVFGLFMPPRLAQ